MERPRRVVSRSSSRGSVVGGSAMRALEKKNKVESGGGSTDWNKKPGGVQETNKGY